MFKRLFNLRIRTRPQASGCAMQGEADAGRLICLYLLSLPVLLGSWERLKLVYTAGDTPYPMLDQRYIDHPLLTLMHLGAGVVYFVLAPLQFSTTLRRAAPRLHRWSGVICIAMGTLSAFAIMVMVIVFPALGGLLTQTVTIPLNLMMIACFILGLAAIRARNARLHRAMMLRAYAIALSVATARVFIFLAETVLGLPFESSFTVASGLGVFVNLVLIEYYLARSSVARADPLRPPG